MVRPDVTDEDAVLERLKELKVIWNVSKRNRNMLMLFSIFIGK